MEEKAQEEDPTARSGIEQEATQRAVGSHEDAAAGETDTNLSLPDSEEAALAARKKVVADGAHKYGPSGSLAEGRRKDRRESLRHTWRLEYREKVKRPVKSYRVGSQRLTDEERRAEEAAAARRRYAAEVMVFEGRSVRGYQDLSALTEEERAARRRKQKAEAEKRRRAKRGASKPDQDKR